MARAALRYDNWKIVFEEQCAPGTLHLAERVSQPPMLRRSSLDSPLEGIGFEPLVPGR
jgi:hypothetical protein